MPGRGGVVRRRRLLDVLREVVEVRAARVQPIESAQHRVDHVGVTARVRESERGVRLADGRRGAQPDLEGVRVPVYDGERRADAREAARNVGSGEVASQEHAARKVSATWTVIGA